MHGDKHNREATAEDAKGFLLPITDLHVNDKVQ
jgi:hypothetical protein